MTRAERILAPRWRSALLLCALVVLTGAVIIIWARIDSGDRRADELAAKADKAAAEADLRGTAVSTLVGDVRALRQQVQAAGKTPVAPDPARAVPSLSARTEVPVPIPGPAGPTGSPGINGASGATGSAGPTGAPGVAGVQGPVGPTGPAGPAGPAGADGQDGKDGADGKDGTDGQACPTGYTWQAPADDPDALVCRKASAPSPSPTEGGLGLAVLAATATYRRL
ncbi:collagen-like protein [Streptomyces sp. NBC_01262]|uniref:collagen-like protein n=1 Tax=Streptomyces sp. NBC_01262 TaxID=2903803 RepID=UPI002E33FAB3|nr:collagen-like protein [Streptomyces sp. NBC_01262]